MRTTKQSNNETTKRAPARTLEARENQLIAKAMDFAEREMDNGTASSQIVSNFLKLGSTRAQLEKEKLAKEVELLKAKTDSIKSAETMAEMYTNALSAMQIYSGSGSTEEHND